MLLAAPSLVIIGLAFGPDPRELELADGLEARSAGYVGSTACRACHLDHHGSWARTFHSTMTQEAVHGSVLGAFDGVEVEFYGQRATPLTRDGRFFMRLPAYGGLPPREVEVAITVGSRRYQQYFERVEAESGWALRRLPILWHIEERRWLHMNTAFLEPDSPDWAAHAQLWNENCIFCHNTGVAPKMRGRDEAPSLPRTFDSHVGELGISCEACHGPGAEHAASHSSLLGRLSARADGEPDDTIIDPLDLDQHAAVAVCGQCHAQRLPDPLSRIAELLEAGPTFRPGDALTDHVAPITCETLSVNPREPDLFRQRFWGDGTARLTAYEYQGTVASPCFEGGELTCNSCHVMHGGDVHGQIEPELRGDQACLQCHGEYADDPRAHTGHDPAQSGGRCLDCHMPEIVYGVLGIHRSHRIEVPDVKRDVEAGRPNACTACHPDRSALWAADAMRELWGDAYERPTARPDGAPLDMPELLASLFAGDVVQRAVAVHHAGRTDTALEARDKAFLVAGLGITLGDGYPALRHLARRALLALDEELDLGLGAALTTWNPTLGSDERRALVQRVQDLLGAGAARFDPPGAAQLLSPDLSLDLARVIELLELQSESVISIGE